MRKSNSNKRATWAVWCAIAPCLLLLSCAPSTRKAITFESALRDLHGKDLASPHAAVSGMLSSFDRMGGNVDWADLKACWIGDDRYVLADLKGPGCVRRLWMTNVNATEWEFYFDGESEPRLHRTESDLFAIRNAGIFPFVPPLADWISGASFSYVPLPYEKSLKIVARIPNVTPNSRAYFHVNYESFPAGASVESFPEKLTDVQRAAVQETLDVLSAAEASMGNVAKRLILSSHTVPANGSVTIHETTGQPGTVNTLAFRLGARPGADAVQQARALRELLLTITWDGAAAPSVEVPLGDFFCNGLHERRFASLFMANVEGTLICRFPMPFRTGAKIEIRNDGPVEAPFQSAVEATPGDPGNGLYFHAAWNHAVNGGTPLRVMRTEGKGTFLGCYLIALAMEGGWNILEGDERFFRDGDLRPVHHGTGLEDYFNSGWYYYGLFEQPFHGLLEKAAMRTAQYRFHVSDPVTFEKSLMMQFEFGDANRAKGYMSAASYWYLDKPGPSGSSIPPAAQRFPEMERIGVATSMDALFELERTGLDREAEERSAYFAALFGDTPLGQIYALRTLAYREIRDGAESVRDAYRAMAEKPDLIPEVAEQAKLLLWRSEKPGRALFGGCANAAFRLYADGTLLGSWNSPYVFQAFPVELTPGAHVLRAEVKSSSDQSWYALGFSASFTTVVSDVSWDYAETRPDGWPGSDGDPALWKPYAQNLWFFPHMNWWQFSPNAYPCVQSGQQVGGPVPGWEKPVGRIIYLRRRIEVPEEMGMRSNPFRRRLAIRTPPIRPAGDTSNEGLQHR